MNRGRSNDEKISLMGSSNPSLKRMARNFQTIHPGVGTILDSLSVSMDALAVAELTIASAIAKQD